MNMTFSPLASVLLLSLAARGVLAEMEYPAKTMKNPNALGRLPRGAKVISNPDEVIHYTGATFVSKGQQLRVESDIPVVVGRHTTTNDSHLNTLVIVKSKNCQHMSDLAPEVRKEEVNLDHLCGPEFKRITIVAWQKNVSSGTENVTVSEHNASAALSRQRITENRQNASLPVQVLDTSAITQDEICFERPMQCTPVNDKPGGTSAALESGGADRLENADKESPIEEEEQDQCVVNVEIIYWGCLNSLQVDAPSTVLRDMRIYKETPLWDASRCNCSSIANFSNVIDMPPPDGSPVQELPQLPVSGACYEQTSSSAAFERWTFHMMTMFASVFWCLMVFK